MASPKSRFCSRDQSDRTSRSRDAPVTERRAHATPVTERRAHATPVTERRAHATRRSVTVWLTTRRSVTVWLTRHDDAIVRSISSKVQSDVAQSILKNGGRGVLAMTEAGLLDHVVDEIVRPLGINPRGRQQYECHRHCE